MENQTHSGVLDVAETCAGRFFGVHVVRNPLYPHGGERAYVLLDVRDASGQEILTHGLDRISAHRLLSMLTHAVQHVETLTS